MEHINARIGHDFLFNERFLRNKAFLQLHIAGNMVVMMAIIVGCQKNNKPNKMRNLSLLLRKRLTSPICSCPNLENQRNIAFSQHGNSLSKTGTV